MFAPVFSTGSSAGILTALLTDTGVPLSSFHASPISRSIYIGSPKADLVELAYTAGIVFCLVILVFVTAVTVAPCLILFEPSYSIEPERVQAVSVLVCVTVFVTFTVYVAENVSVVAGIRGGGLPLTGDRNLSFVISHSSSPPFLP